MPKKLLPFLFLWLFASLSFVGCKKQTTEPLEINQPQKISMEEIQNWVGAFNLKISEQPVLIYGLAQKTTFKDKSYVRIPIYIEGKTGGSFYFSKDVDGTLQALYVTINQRDSSKQDGNVGFVDFDHKTITVATYLNNKPIAFNTIKESTGIFNMLFINGVAGVRKQIYSGGGEVIPCGDQPKTIWEILATLLNDLLAAFSSEEGSGQNIASSSSSYLYWDFSGFIGNDVSNSGPYPVGWGTYDDSINYTNFNRTDIETGDEDNNTKDDYDYTNYSEFDDQTQQWPTIQNVILNSEFVGWNRILHPSWQCMEYAKDQIKKKKYQISDYGDPDQTFQVYTQSNGANKTAVKMGISYLIDYLQKGIPSIVGVDDEPGSPNPNTDNTTDHFIVIVGMGSDINGNFFTFYDNASGNPYQGANINNKLYYIQSSGLITGKSQTDYAKAPNRHDYIVTMIRKSKLIR